MAKRRAMTTARKRRIWESRCGLCGECGLPVEILGPSVVYDHRIPLWISEDDSDEGIWPIHKDPCDKKKTAADLTRIYKTKRQAQIMRPRPPSKIKSRGFDKRLRRKIDGTVEPK